MARNKKIETVLEAWWARDYAEVSERGEAQRRLDQLLDEVIGTQPFTRDDLLDHLWGEYRDYKLARRRAEKVRIAQRIRSGQS